MVKGAITYVNNQVAVLIGHSPILTVTVHSQLQLFKR